MSGPGNKKNEQTLDVCATVTSQSVKEQSMPSSQETAFFLSFLFLTEGICFGTFSCMNTIDDRRLRFENAVLVGR